MSGSLPVIESPFLAAQGMTHGFFTREGGVSKGLYATLNGGVGSDDMPEAVAENRARMAAHLGVIPAHLLVPYQTHSPDAVAVSAPFAPHDRPRCDALVTATPGLALGVTGADCGITLFCDPAARVIGAAHSGWKGALNGVLEATVSAMEELGAARRSIIAVLGPTIGPRSYEVGQDFLASFRAASDDYMRFFAPGPRPAHFWFDLPDFIGMRLKKAGIGRFENLGLDTYADEARFFSYRRSVHRKEPDYGRQIAAIALV